jgi:hypothetical protein
MKTRNIRVFFLNQNIYENNYEPKLKKKPKLARSAPITDHILIDVLHRTCFNSKREET